jgi:septin family protein
VVLIQALGEAFRRTMWALIRIENEKVNNFEKYRNILTIPSFKDEELHQTKKSV